MKLSAVLLAGGESRRFGRDKATALLHGKPLWWRQLHLLQSLNPGEVFISARTDPVWRPPAIPFVADVPPSRGPLSGLVAALEFMKGTHLLALAVDMPFMSTTHLQKICELVQAKQGVLPYIGDRAEPMAAVYPQGSLDQFSNSLDRGELSLQLVTHKLVSAGMLSAFQISPPEQEFYRNVNVPVDLVSAATVGSAYSSLEGATS